MKIYKLLLVSLGTILLAVTLGHVVHAQTAPAAPPAGSTLEQRISQRKAERTIKLEKKDETRLIAQCDKTQTKLRDVQQQAAGAATNRAKTYQQIDAQLWIIIGRLKLAEKDTFKLEKARGQLSEKAAIFQAIGDNYRQSLDDSVVINCQADPAGFKALLETTKIYYGQWRDQATNIKTFLINDIKPALSEHAKSLQPSFNTGGGN